MHMVDLMSSIVCEGDSVSQELLDTLLVNLVPAHKVHTHCTQYTHTHTHTVHTHTHTVHTHAQTLCPRIYQTATHWECQNSRHTHSPQTHSVWM